MLLAPLLLLSVQAPVAPGQAAAPAAPAFVSRRGGRLFISPMGEPFRPSGHEDDTLADWFRQADTNHDGQLTLQEMQADADRFFALLDVNHDGEIDPDEITRYEKEVAPEISSGGFGLLSFDENGEGGRHHGGGEGRRFLHTQDQHQGAGRFGLLDLPEPVVSADTDFNRGVSRTEFQAAAAQRFLALDVDHKGYLTLPLLETIRPAPPVAPKAPDRPASTEEVLPPEGGPGL